MTTLVGVLGWPVETTAARRRCTTRRSRPSGLDWRYEFLPVEPERFESFVRALPERGLRGRERDDPAQAPGARLADAETEVATAVGAANTLSFRAGAIEAHNTDVEGISGRAPRARARGPRGHGGRLVLGAGGAARAAVFALLSKKRPASAVWNRHPERAQELVADLRPYAAETVLEAFRAGAGPLGPRS